MEYWGTSGGLRTSGTPFLLGYKDGESNLFYPLTNFFFLQTLPLIPVFALTPLVDSKELNLINIEYLYIEYIKSIILKYKEA